MAGYGERFLTTHVGVHDRVRSTALWVERGPTRLALVSVDLCGESCLSPTMRVVRVDRAGDAITRAVLVHYAGHPTILRAEDRRIGRDWPGGLIDEVERRFPGAAALFFNGAAGDLNVGPTAEQVRAQPSDRYEQAEAVGQ